MSKPDSRTDNSTDLDALRQEIDQTRAELGQTVHELAGRVDVRTRVRGVAGRAAGWAGHPPVLCVLLSAGAAAAAVATAALVYGRRR